jgi:hypothetical protein
MMTNFEFALIFMAIVCLAIHLYGFHKIQRTARRWRWSAEELSDNAREQEERIDEHHRAKLPSS